MALTIGVCAQSITEGYLIAGFLAFAIILLVMGFRMPILGLFGGLSLLVLSWFIVGCIGLIGYIIATLGLVSIIFFALRKEG